MSEATKADSSDMEAAWIRLAQAVSISDRVAAPIECETTIRVSQAILGMSVDAIRAAKVAAGDLSVEAAVEVVRGSEVATRNRLLLCLINIAFADGVFRSAENRLISAIARRWELDLEMLVAAFSVARQTTPIDEITANESVLG